MALTLIVILPACSAAPTPPLALPAPAVMEHVAKAPPTADPYDGVDLPELGECEEASASEQVDPRCPEQIVFSSVLSHLDKTTAEFDGGQMREIEYDPDALWMEATADAEFRGMLVRADASGDGVLDQAEALSLEAEVLVRWEQRTMARAQ